MRARFLQYSSGFLLTQRFIGPEMRLRCCRGERLLRHQTNCRIASLTPSLHVT